MSFVILKHGAGEAANGTDAEGGTTTSGGLAMGGSGSGKGGGGGGGGGGADGGAAAAFGLTNFEQVARNHAHIAFFAYFVGLPLGVIIARYLRTFTRRWLLPHMLVNGLLVAPLVIASFVLGYQASSMAEEDERSGHFNDPHKIGGLVLFIMYWAQVLLGSFIHWIKFPASFTGRRPQNYVHVAFGLAIVALASWQTHYGLYTEWALATENRHPIANGCKRFWLATLIVVWALYAIGLALFLPRQIRQERAARLWQGPAPVYGTKERATTVL